MKQIDLRKTVGFVALVVLLPTLAFAFGGQGRGGGQNGPPQAAIDACSGKNAGDVVEFSNRRNETISGTCQGQNGTMSAVAENRRGGKSRRQ